MRKILPIAIGEHGGKGIWYDHTTDQFLTTKSQHFPKNYTITVVTLSLICLAIIRLLEQAFSLRYLSYRIILLIVLSFSVIIITKKFKEETLSGLELTSISLSSSTILELIEDGRKKVKVLILTFLLSLLVGIFTGFYYLMTSSFSGLVSTLFCIFLCFLIVFSTPLKRFKLLKSLEERSSNEFE